MEALREMHRQVGDLEIDEAGVATRGLLVRHLVMPGGVAGTEEVMRFLATEISRTHVRQHHGPVPPLLEGREGRRDQPLDHPRGIRTSPGAGAPGGAVQVG